jgi:hypothetical protein
VGSRRNRGHTRGTNERWLCRRHRRVLFVRLGFIVTEVANLSLDASRMHVRRLQFPSCSQPRSTNDEVRGENPPQSPQAHVEQLDGEVRKRHSPALAWPPIIASHMTPSTVQAGMVYLSPSGHLWRAFLDVSHKRLLIFTFSSHFSLCRGCRVS